MKGRKDNPWSGTRGCKLTIRGLIFDIKPMKDKIRITITMEKKSGEWVLELPR